MEIIRLRIGRVMICESCDCQTDEPENEYGEFVCLSCQSNRNEAAYERHCADYHDGGSTQFKSLREQMAEARRLK